MRDCSSDKIKVVIQGAYGEANFGDDALLHVIHKKLLPFYKQEEILVLCNSRPRKYSMSEFSGKSEVVWRYDSDVKKAKLWIIGGGTQVFKFKKTSSFLNRILIIFKDPVMVLKKLLQIFFTDERQDKKVFLGVGMGPFENGEKEKIIKRVVGKNDDVFFRDSLSAKYYSQVYKKDVDHYADICFSDDVSGFCRKREKLNKVGIVLRDWEHSKNEFTPLNIAKKLPSSINFTFVFFGDDKASISECEDNGFEYIKYNPSMHGYNGFLFILSQFDMLVTSRFHALVYGVMLELPVIALNIEPKLAVAAKDMGIGIIDSLDGGFSNIFYASRADYVALVDKSKAVKAASMLKAAKMVNKFEEVLIESRNVASE